MLNDLTTMSRYHSLTELPIVQPLKNFPAFYGTRRFITVFKRALHLSLSWARSIQSITSHPISLRSILILFTHLRLGLPSGLLHSGFQTNILYWFESPDHSNYTWRIIQVMKLFIMQFSRYTCQKTYCSLIHKFIRESSLLMPSAYSDGWMWLRLFCWKPAVQISY
jgi:hypothetical protein